MDVGKRHNICHAVRVVRLFFRFCSRFGLFLLRTLICPLEPNGILLLFGSCFALEDLVVRLTFRLFCCKTLFARFLCFCLLQFLRTLLEDAFKRDLVSLVSLHTQDIRVGKGLFEVAAITEVPQNMEQIQIIRLLVQARQKSHRDQSKSGGDIQFSRNCRGYNQDDQQRRNTANDQICNRNSLE